MRLRANLQGSNAAGFASEVFSRVEPIVASKLPVLASGIENGVPYLLVRVDDNTVLRGVRELVEKENFTITVRKGTEKEVAVLNILPKVVPARADLRWNILLFLATVGTVFYAGYASFTSPYFPDPVANAAEYAAALFAILIAHEGSHFLTSRHHSVAATLPYFIPAIPPIGTFGAVIRSREPFKDRDQLFDIGFSGPLGGFVVACVASVVGITTSPIVPPSAVSSLSALPFNPVFMQLLFFFVHSNGVLLISPVGFAAWVGLLVTFLNSLPSAQLDGGHVLRSFVSTRLHARISLGVAVALILLSLAVIPSFLFMGFFMLLLSLYGHPGPLDDYTPVSHGRRAMLALWVLVIVLSAPFPA